MAKKQKTKPKSAVTPDTEEDKVVKNVVDIDTGPLFMPSDIDHEARINIGQHTYSHMPAVEEAYPFDADYNVRVIEAGEVTAGAAVCIAIYDAGGNGDTEAFTPPRIAALIPVYGAKSPADVNLRDWHVLKTIWAAREKVLRTDLNRALDMHRKLIASMKKLGETLNEVNNDLFDVVLGDNATAMTTDAYGELVDKMTVEATKLSSLVSMYQTIVTTLQSEPKEPDEI